MTFPREPNERDPLAAYTDGDPDAVRGVAPPEPSEAEWEATRQHIHARLCRPYVPTARRSRRMALAGVAALIAAALAWLAFHRAAQPEQPRTREVVDTKPLPVAPAPHVPEQDPLAEFAVLPMATAEEVVLHRVPGDGWLPVGAHPLPGALALATADEVELDDADAAWPDVTPAPGFAPMIFAAKPR